MRTYSGQVGTQISHMNYTYEPLAGSIKNFAIWISQKLM